MPFNSIRNYFAENLARLRNEWKNFQSHDSDPELTSQTIQDSDTRRHYLRVRATHEVDIKILESEYQQLYQTFTHKNDLKFEPFELFKRPLEAPPVPETRTAAPGLNSVPVYYHSERIILANPETSRALSPDNEADYAESYLPGDIDFGPPVDPILRTLITRKYLEYLPFLDKYCRPAGTTDATFRDFNKPQTPSSPPTTERKTQVLELIDHFLDCTPFLPLHFVDTMFCKLPLVTGTGYHNRHSFKQRAHAKFSHPEEYHDRPTSKGYYINATYENARTIVHRIKDSGYPFDFTDDINPDMSDKAFLALIQKLNAFFNSYPTMLFTRNHISDRTGTLKVRPVYAVDDLFLIIELMLTFPATVQCRKPTCSVMHSLETLRGANHLLDSLAKSYSSFFTIDWSGYDQRLPRPITDIFFTDYLRSKIIISDGYQPTMEWTDYSDLNEHTMYSRMDNLLHFLHLWYNNMTFLSADGYSYRRLFAGVPSGLYNTQHLDSFGNLFLIIDSMLEFGFSDSQIKEILLFVLGDDNSAFTNWPFELLHEYISFLESYALTRWNMVLSKTKSVITFLRSKIETLAYQCNFGMPKRPIGKLVAQLCYPEHGIKYRTMSARAIGLAYASCGQDSTFHELCRDVFHMFLPFYDLTDRERLTLLRQLMPTDTSDEISLNFETFPTIDTVRTFISKYQGPLSYDSKWNKAHFMRAPDNPPDFFLTMQDYEYLNDLKVREAPSLLHVNQIDINQVADFLG
nr:RNA-dependent RNA polymerase [Sarcosphaera coronaria partitivirus]